MLVYVKNPTKEYETKSSYESIRLRLLVYEHAPYNNIKVKIHIMVSTTVIGTIKQGGKKGKLVTMDIHKKYSHHVRH